MNFAKALEAFFQDNQVHARPGRTSFVMTCLNPACAKEQHLWVRKSNGRAICFRCNERWDWRGVVAATARCSRGEAHAVLFGEGGGDNLEKYDDPFALQAETRSKDKPVALGWDMVPAEESEAAMAYLASRNVQPQKIVDFDVRWNGTMGAVVFPVRMDGVLYGWQARRVAPEEGQLRLISSNPFNKSHFLLNYDRARHMPGLAVLEGPFDTANGDVVPGIGGVGTLGKGVSMEQIALILRSDAEKLYIGLDPDAFEQVYELVDLLGLRKQVFRPRVPAHRSDFGECLVAEVTEAYKLALPMSGQVDVLDVYFK
jgi:hypothetical protein